MVVGVGGCVLVGMGGWVCVVVGGYWWLSVGVGECGWVCVSDENRTRATRLRGERANHYVTSPQNKNSQKVDIAGNRSGGRLLRSPTR